MGPFAFRLALNKARNSHKNWHRKLGQVKSSKDVTNTVFISYAHEDKPTADAVCAKLEQSGIRCWIAPRDIQPGQEWGDSIIAAIEKAKVMVLVFSDRSNNSKQVLREVTAAVKHNVIVIPFRVENVEPCRSMEYLLSVPHWLDALTPPLEKHIDELSVTIAQLLNHREGGEEIPVDHGTLRDQAREDSSTKTIPALRRFWMRISLILFVTAIGVLFLKQHGLFGVAGSSLGRASGRVENPPYDAPYDKLTGNHSAGETGAIGWQYLVEVSRNAGTRQPDEGNNSFAWKNLQLALDGDYLIYRVNVKVWKREAAPITQIFLAIGNEAAKCFYNGIPGTDAAEEFIEYSGKTPLPALSPGEKVPVYLVKTLDYTIASALSGVHEGLGLREEVGAIERK